MLLCAGWDGSGESDIGLVNYYYLDVFSTIMMSRIRHLQAVQSRQEPHFLHGRTEEVRVLKSDHHENQS